MKLNTQSIKDAFFSHGEKLVLLIFLCLFLGFVWKAVGVKGIEKNPKDLSSATNSAKNNLERDPEFTIPLEDYLEMAQNITKPVSLSDLETPTAWNPPLFPSRKKREEPKILPIYGLQVTSGSGKVQRKRTEKNASSDSMGIHWNVITGLIPLQEQFAAFNVAVGDSVAKSPTDLPIYINFQIQRAEISEDDNPDKLEWKDYSMQNNWRYAARFGADSVSSNLTGIEVRFAPPALRRIKPADRATSSATSKTPELIYTENSSLSLVASLPPLMNQNIKWGPEIAHLPEIPIIIENSQNNHDDDPIPENMNPDQDNSSDFENNEVTPDNGTAENIEEPVRLFRYVDYLVRPGKRYAYRVKVTLANPNYNFKPAHYLANEELRKSPELYSDWSKPSELCLVPRDERLLAVGAQNKKNRSQVDYSTAALMLIKFDMNTGNELANEFKTKTGLTYEDRLSLGSAGNTSEEKTKNKNKKVVDPMIESGQVLNLTALGPIKDPSDTAPDPENQPVTYNTNYILLDIRGGEALFTGKETSESMYAPSRMLLLAPNGKFITLDELENKEDVFARQVIIPENLK